MGKSFGWSNVVLRCPTILTDPNTGEEAKERAKAKLEEHGVEVTE